jgi:hypothetical protein
MLYMRFRINRCRYNRARLYTVAGKILGMAMKSKNREKQTTPDDEQNPKTEKCLTSNAISVICMYYATCTRLFGPALRSELQTTLCYPLTRI